MILPQTGMSKFYKFFFIPIGILPLFIMIPFILKFFGKNSHVGGGNIAIIVPVSFCFMVFLSTFIAFTVIKKKVSKNGITKLNVSKAEITIEYPGTVTRLNTNDIEEILLEKSEHKIPGFFQKSSGICAAGKIILRTDNKYSVFGTRFKIDELQWIYDAIIVMLLQN